MFRVYATTPQRLPLSRIAEHARRAEALGYDGLAVPEAVHDGLLLAGAALAATSRLRVLTSVLVTFARSPMAVAIAAWDLEEASGGRFELGLGSQVRANVVERYGAAWDPPVERMREYVGALRAIFSSWQEGGELRFEGKHYRLTRMQPFFRPDPLPAPGGVPIYLGGVRPRMTALAGGAADGLLTHPTNTSPRYLGEVLRPRLERAARQAGRSAAPRLYVGVRIATGRDGDAVRQERERARRTLAFLFSTPAYWPSLESHGWRDRGERLRALTREGRWQEMERVLDDEMLDAFVPSGGYGEIAGVLRRWYGGLTDWIAFPMPEDPADDRAAAAAVAALRGD